MMTITGEFEKTVRKFLLSKNHYDLRQEFQVIRSILSIEHIEDSLLIDEIDLIQQCMYEELVDRFVKEDFMCHFGPGQLCCLAGVEEEGGASANFSAVAPTSQVS